MKNFIVFVLVFITVAVLVGGITFSLNHRAHDNIAFLKSYGWEVKNKPIEVENITLPAEFDAVYTAYNELQIQAGLDLTPHLGKSGTRYTYIVTNYPEDVGKEVRANLLVIDGVPIAGDICTVSLDGFMHSLYSPRK